MQRGTAAVERVFREEYGRLIASLVRRFGDIDIAEEAAGEALVAVPAGGSNPMLEIGQNREYPTVPLFGAVDAELRQDVRHMGLDRPLVDPESVPDPSVGPTLRHQREHIAFTGSQ
jgi:RNA polymerase sigma-70 factor (ECF subfamily)